LSSSATPYGTIDHNNSNPYKSRSVRASVKYRDVDDNIQHNLSQIANYKKEINTVLESLDKRLLQVTENSQKQMSFDFEMWLQVKDRDYKEVTKQINEKLAIKDQNEEVVARLRRNLEIEEAKRFALDQAKEALQEELKGKERIGDKLKKDVVNYKQLLKDEQ